MGSTENEDGERRVYSVLPRCVTVAAQDLGHVNMTDGDSPQKPRSTEFLSKYADSLEAFIQEEVKQSKY